jgi:hypothetical protein
MELEKIAAIGVAVLAWFAGLWLYFRRYPTSKRRRK